MAIWLPILAVLLLVGSFMWLKPSPRDKYLAKLRSSALAQGFSLGSLRVPDTSANGRVNQRFQIVTLYQLPVQLSANSGGRFTVLRTTGEAGAYLPDGWIWDERDGLNESQYHHLKDILTALPLSVQVISLSSGSVGLSWDERDPELSFERLKWVLAEITLMAQQKLVGAA